MPAPSDTHDTPTPQSPRDHLRRAYLLLSWGKLGDAIAACDAAQQTLAPDHHPLPDILKGAIWLAGGRLDEALAQLKATVERWPDHPLAQLHFAEACLIDGRHRQARRAIKRAASLDDGSHDEFVRALRRAADDAADDHEPLVVGTAAFQSHA